MAGHPSRIVTAVLACAATTAISLNALAQGQAATAGDTKQIPLPADMNVQFDRAVAAKTQPTPPDLVKDVGRAIALGNEIYLNDWASAVGTDVLVEKAGDLRGKVSGYLTFREGDGSGLQPSYRVWFFTTDDPPRVAYTVRVPLEPGRDRTVETLSPPEAPSAFLATMFRARQAAVAAIAPIVQPPNPVVMPAAVLGEEGILVEVIAGTTKPNLAVLGRHCRVVVSEDGSRVTKVFPLSRGVIELPTNNCPNQAKCLALAVNHIVTEAPVETHVFASLLNRIDLYVTTSRGWWRVKGATVEFLGSLDDKNGK
jgi:hypothetical protein